MTIKRGRSAFAGSLLLIAGVAGACFTTTGPATAVPLTVVLSGPSVVQGHDTNVAGTPSYVCYYRLTATANGGFTNEVATWGEGNFTYHGQNGAMYSGNYPSAAALFFPYTAVPAGGQLSAMEHDVWTEPFQATLVLYYTTTTDNTADSTTYSYSCK
jgi:hypothetical protein